MSSQTKAVQNIINSIHRSLAASCVSYPEIMLNCILDRAQEYVNEDGYVWDVALAKACEIYPSTRYCGLCAYES
jgi:PIN domain nuclease of toxin-antitoxin system